MSRPEAARDFLAHYLPGELTALLNLESLEVTKNSFVDKDLRERFSDLLYFSDDPGNRLPEILALLKGLLEERSGLEYLQTALKYVAPGSVHLSDKEIEKAVTDGLKDKGDNIMPTWLKDGLNRGCSKGCSRGCSKALKRVT